MSTRTVMGFVVGLGFFLLSIVLATDDYSFFVSVPSAIRVFGVTLIKDLRRYPNNMMLELFLMPAEQRTPRYIRDRIGSFLQPELLHRVLEENRQGGETA